MIIIKCSKSKKEVAKFKTAGVEYNAYMRKNSLKIVANNGNIKYVEKV